MWRRQKVKNLFPEAIHDGMVKHWFSTAEDRRVFREWSGSAMSKPIVTHIAERLYGLSAGELVKGGVIPKDTISHLVTAIKSRLAEVHHQNQYQNQRQHQQQIRPSDEGALMMEPPVGAKRPLYSVGQQTDRTQRRQERIKRARQTDTADEWVTEIDTSDMGGPLSDYGATERLLHSGLDSVNIDAVDTTDRHISMEEAPSNVDLDASAADTTGQEDLGGDFQVSAAAIPVSDTSVPAEEVPGFEDLAEEDHTDTVMDIVPDKKDDRGLPPYMLDDKAMEEPILLPDFDQIPTGVERIDPRALWDTLNRIREQVNDSSVNTNNLMINVTDMRRLLEDLPGKICDQLSKELQKLEPRGGTHRSPSMP